MRLNLSINAKQKPKNDSALFVYIYDDKFKYILYNSF